uniref:EF-hand domain-containing protein n=1 Tax=Schlesneria paludicola TaxID=360056 RepID=A0A7C2K101_9PLAN
MLRRTCLPILLLGAIGAIAADKLACAQDRERAEGLFKFTDRNNDGEIDPEEFRRLSDGTRERLQKLGVSGSRNIKKEEFISGIEGVEELRRKEQAERDRERGVTSSSSPPGRGSLIAGGRGSARKRVTLDLPTQYAAMDKNGDGQVALSEWDRAKLVEFRQLDRNGDGFLAPRELVNPSITPTAASSGTPNTAAKPAASSSLPGAPPQGNAAAVVNAKPGSPTPQPAAPPAEQEDPVLRQARFYFSSVDKDKDGQISNEEWTSSRGARPLFENANVAVTLPMAQDVFIEHFKQIKQGPK